MSARAWRAKGADIDIGERPLEEAGLARASEAVAGIPLAGPHPGRAELHRATRRGLTPEEAFLQAPSWAPPPRRAHLAVLSHRSQLLLRVHNRRHGLLHRRLDEPRASARVHVA